VSIKFTIFFRSRDQLIVTDMQLYSKFAWTLSAWLEHWHQTRAKLLAQGPCHYSPLLRCPSLASPPCEPCLLLWQTCNCTPNLLVLSPLGWSTGIKPEPSFWHRAHATTPRHFAASLLPLRSQYSMTNWRSLQLQVPHWKLWKMLFTYNLSWICSISIMSRMIWCIHWRFSSMMKMIQGIWIINPMSTWLGIWEQYPVEMLLIATSFYVDMSIWQVPHSLRMDWPLHWILWRIIVMIIWTPRSWKNTSYIRFPNKEVIYTSALLLDFSLMTKKKNANGSPIL